MSTQKRRDEEFAREIRAHVDIETARLIEEGMAPDQARAAARRAFGNVTRAQERFYERGRLPWIDHLRQAVRSAISNIRHYPVAALVAVVSLAGGIGATTVTLMVRDVLFHQAPPLYVDPPTISRVQIGTPERPVMPIGGYVPAALYAGWRDTLDFPIAAAGLARGERDLRVERRTESVAVRQVTPEFFDLLGIRPEIGRLLAPGDAMAGGPAPAVLSYRIWERVFDRRPDAIGRAIWIDNQPYTIAGVLPRPFWFSDWGSPVWTRLDPRPVPPDEGLEMIVRRPPQLSPALLDARLQAGLPSTRAAFPRLCRIPVDAVPGVEGTRLASGSADPPPIPGVRPPTCSSPAPTSPSSRSRSGRRGNGYPRVNGAGRRINPRAADQWCRWRRSAAWPASAPRSASRRLARRRGGDDGRKWFHRPGDLHCSRDCVGIIAGVAPAGETRRLHEPGTRGVRSRAAAMAAHARRRGSS